MTKDYMDIVVAGLHLTGQPLNQQLIALGGKLARVCKTAARYKMYLIQDDKGRKPGLVRVSPDKSGKAYEVEVWSLPMENIGKLLSLIPPPLGLGTVTLEDEMNVKGFICEPRVVTEGTDISNFSGWKHFLENSK